MAIDPRIALGIQQVQTQSPSQVLDIFQTNLNQAQSRRANQQLIDQRDITNPLQAQLLQEQANRAPIQSQLLQQQQVAGEQQQSVDIENRTIRAASEFGTQVKPVLESGNVEQAQAMFTSHIADLKAKGLPTQGAEQILEQLAGGNSQGVLSALDSMQTIARQRGLLGTAGAVQSSQFIPGVGFATLSKGGQAELVSVKGVGETVAEKRLADIEKSATIETKKSQLGSAAAAKKLAVTKSGVAFDKLANIDVALSNFDDAIRAIDEGAQTGTIISSLPSFRKSSIELDNIQKSLGLDVVSNTTFGALSESELKFALDKALPKNLQPQDLKTWLQAKKSAQTKLRDHISDAAQFLGTGENTIPDWIELQKARAVIQQQPEQAISKVAPATEKGEGTIMVDAKGNRARVFADGTFEEL